MFPLERKVGKHSLLPILFSSEVTSQQWRSESTLGKCMRTLSIQAGFLPVPAQPETVSWEASVGCLVSVASWDPCYHCCFNVASFCAAPHCLFGVLLRRAKGSKTLSLILPIDAQVQGPYLFCDLVLTSTAWLQVCQLMLQRGGGGGGWGVVE